MSELIIANKADLVAVADAIREKTGKTEQMHLAQFAEKIAGIESGGSGMTETDFIRAVSEGYRAIAGTDYTDGLLMFNRFPSNGSYWIILWHNRANPCLTLYIREGTFERGSLNIRMTVNNIGSGNYMRRGTYDKFKFDKTLDTTMYTKQRFEHISGHLTLDVQPNHVHPAISKYFNYGIENHMEEVLNKIKFKDLFNVTEYDASYDHVICYKWGDYIYINFVKSESLPYIDYTASSFFSAGKGGSPYLYKALLTPTAGVLRAYANYETGTSADICNKQEVSLVSYTAPQNGSTTHFSTLISDLESNVYFNSFDLKDENGNVLLNANCTISDFVE